ncbi:C-signal-like [Elgaria multicarinata webbii]|uniref:C-signal-like n=1 Tax=Elgaria multicarinata webbii TaxID=159646 RepID=UPI002FCD48A0
MAKRDFTVHSVLVTGSSSGIGLGLVKQFLKLPTPPQWIFATFYERDEEKNRDINNLVSQYSNLVLLYLDVTDRKSIVAAAEEVQKYVGECGLTLLMNNAGILINATLQEETAKNMAVEYAVNTMGPLQVSQVFLPLLEMAAERSPQEGLSCSKAAIINTCSSGGSLELMAYFDLLEIVGYRCSKAALSMLTRCQSLEYPDYGILCACIHPGAVKTNLTEWQGEQSVEQSTRGIIKVLSTLSEEDNGSFVDWEGRRVPW